jgi:hypothetical protein
MARHMLRLIGIVLIMSNVAAAAITVHEPNFAVDVLLNQIDGGIPRLEAISNPEYGFGVLTASVDEGILKLLRISQSSIELFTTMSGFPADSTVGAIRFDRTGLFANELYVTAWTDTAVPGDWRHNVATRLFSVSVDGTFNQIGTYGDVVDRLLFILDFTTGAGGYLPGAYLEDFSANGGTSLYHMDSEPNVTKLSQHLVPPGRSDLDIWGMQFDPTGKYGSYLTLADSDTGHDELTVIYQLLPDLSWQELTTPVSTSVRYYHDMCFSSGGAFGEILYVTDAVTETVMSVDPNGVHTVFASGFSDIESIAVSEDGEHMFVSDANGVYRIRAGTTQVGPHIVMREPWVESDDVHTGDLGVDDLRILWSEPVLFDNADVNVVNEDGNDVPFSVSGSNSEFMIIVFGETLLHDRYTITVHDSVQSAETGAGIDGDNDGLAGGDAVLVMEHRQRHDSDNDNDLDFLDFRNFAEKWLWSE